MTKEPLKWLRKLFKTKQVDLAVILGTKRPYISKLERQDSVQLRKLKQVAEHHGAKLSLLVRKDGESFELEL